MLTIYASKQTSFFDSLLKESLAKNELLTKVDSILSSSTKLLQPLVDAYLKDRKLRKTDAGFGRPTIALETFIRLLLLKYLYKNCDLREVENRANTDMAWKAFARLSTADKVPDFTTLNKWEMFFGESVIRRLHDTIISYCQKQKLVKGKSFRTDTTVTEANIHYPTDCSLLKDAARVITRTVNKIKAVVKEKISFRSKLQTINKKVYGIVKFLKNRTNESKAKVKQLTEEIATIVKKVLTEAETAGRQMAGKAGMIGLGLELALDKQIALGKQLVQQTVNVLKGEKIQDRIVSFFQPSMRPISKGKLGKKTEFGKKVEITECENNIITDYNIHIGNPNDAGIFLKAVKRHKQRFKYVPNLVATDRGGGLKRITWS